MNPKANINGKEYSFIKNITDIITNRTAVLCEDKHGCSFFVTRKFGKAVL